jgi:hypothetical protein
MLFNSNQCEFTAIVSHFPNSPHVTDFNCASVFAETIDVEPNRVLNPHKINHETNADFPIPRPELTARRNISGGSPRAARRWFSEM